MIQDAQPTILAHKKKILVLLVFPIASSRSVTFLACSGIFHVTFVFGDVTWVQFCYKMRYKTCMDLWQCLLVLTGH